MKKVYIKKFKNWLWQYTGMSYLKEDVGHIDMKAAFKAGYLDGYATAKIQDLELKLKDPPWGYSKATSKDNSPWF
jgi:hypothetical protein|tara:strand:+ start:529 stop:753 length:225 start_codon:yes stop_codon:yes gene_type:complete